MWKGCSTASIPKGIFSRLFLQKSLPMSGCETPLLVDWTSGLGPPSRTIKVVIDRVFWAGDSIVVWEADEQHLCCQMLGEWPG
jgi:hypothetical protein